MRPTAVKKLLLVPVTLTTACLAMAFVAPTVALGAARTVAPAVQAAAGAASHVPFLASAAKLGTTTQAASQPGPAAPQGQGAASGALVSSGSGNTINGNTTAVDGSGLMTGLTSGDTHQVATGGQQNCGRFGNGFHGGKHNFVCPNRPFPVRRHF